MTRSPGLDPRQRDCWERYINPTSPTFANGKASALAAGFSDSHAENIKQHEWFKRKERRARTYDKGERVLEEMLDMPVLVKVYVGAGDEKKEYVVTDATLVRIKQDTAKFAVERLGKDDWSTRQELTGADGGPLVDPKAKADGDKALDDFLSKNQANPGQ